MKLEREEREHPLTQEKIIRWVKGGAGVIVLTAAATAGWLSMGFPVPATTAYVLEEMAPHIVQVQNIEEFARGTRKIVLRQKQAFLLEEIRKLEEDAEGKGRTPHVRALLEIKRDQERLIVEQIGQLETEE